MTTTIKTNEKTINKAVKAIVRKNVKGIASVKKIHVAGLGYVTYLKNAAGENLAFLTKENSQINLIIK